MCPVVVFGIQIRVQQTGGGSASTLQKRTQRNRAPTGTHRHGYISTVLQGSCSDIHPWRIFSAVESTACHSVVRAGRGSNITQPEKRFMKTVGRKHHAIRFWIQEPEPPYSELRDPVSLRSSYFFPGLVCGKFHRSRLRDYALVGIPSRTREGRSC